MTEAVYFKLISNTSSSVRMIETLELFPRGEYFFFLNQCSKYCLLSTGHLPLSPYIRELNILIHQSLQRHSDSDFTFYYTVYTLHFTLLQRMHIWNIFCCCCSSKEDVQVAPVESKVTPDKMPDFPRIVIQAR